MEEYIAKGIQDRPHLFFLMNQYSDQAERLVNYTGWLAGLCMMSTLLRLCEMMGWDPRWSPALR
jgi:hypothetical protein